MFDILTGSSVPKSRSQAGHHQSACYGRSSYASRSSTFVSLYVHLPVLVLALLLIHNKQNGLKSYRTSIWIAMGLILGTFITVIMTILLSCRPFNHYWQISPNPGSLCQAGDSKPILFVSFILNVSTDIFL